MVGFDNEDISFVLELTYNYGVSEYKRGNDLECILLHRYNQEGVDMKEKLVKEFLGESEYTWKADEVLKMVNNDYLFKFEDTKASSNQLFKGIVLNVVDVEEAFIFYQKIGFIKENEYLVCSGYDIF